MRCGSAIFGIIYSSVTVWAALFSCCILNKSQSPLRVAGILAVVVGLILPTIEQVSQIQTHFPPHGTPHSPHISAFNHSI